MKKILKFKEVESLVKISKNKYFSKGQRKKINMLLLRGFYDLDSLSEKLNVVKSKHNSIKVKYLRYKDLANKLSKEVYISKDSIDKHFIGLGRTGTGKTIRLKEIHKSMIENAKRIDMTEYGSGHLFPERAIPPKDIVIFEDGK